METRGADVSPQENGVLDRQSQEKPLLTPPPTILWTPIQLLPLLAPVHPHWLLFTSAASQLLCGFWVVGLHPSPVPTGAA